MLFFSIVLLVSVPNLPAQSDQKPKLSSDAKKAREYSLGMLDEMSEILNEYYYDPKMKGIELKPRIEAAKARVKTLEYNWQMYRVLVQVLMEFNDSHTRMILPPRTDYFQYGVTWQMIGDDFFITSVKKDSHAASEGVEVGDQVLLIGKHKPTRNDLWKINYLIYKLDPALELDLRIRKPDNTEKTVVMQAKTQTDKEYRAELKLRKNKDKDEDAAFKCQEISKELQACKFYSFMVEKGDVDKMMKQIAKYPKLILDLRGNGGGLVVMEQYLLSHFFDKPVRIANLTTREKTELRTTKVVDPDKQYKGEVVVLIDSRSASAAEMTARVLQIEQRARIMGDYSSGSVMTSITLPFRSVMSAFADAAIIRVGMSVTVADVVMRDGSRLERVGVTPDEVLQPTGLALKTTADVVLASAADKLGATLSMEDAGKFHFMTDAGEEDDSEETDK